MKLDPYFTPSTKWIKNLSVRPETIKFLGKKPKGQTPCHWFWQ